MKKTFLASLLFAAMPVFAATDVADAAMRGDVAAVRKLIAAKADVNAAQNDGATPCTGPCSPPTTNWSTCC